MNEFDELNKLSENELLDIDEYFDEMELSEEEKEKRKEFSRRMNETMLFIFTLFEIMQQYEYINKQFVISQLQSRYSELVLRYINIDRYIEDYIEKFSKEIVDTTLKYLDEEYYLSDDRALIVSVNESNSIMGYRQLEEARKKGYTKKTWITEGDKKVRKTHQMIDGETIPLEEYFFVGNSLMMYPHDNITADVEASEVVNCRCSIKYI